MSRLARLVGSCGGVGRLPGPSGTWASALAIPAAWGLHWLGGFPLLAVATLAAAAAGFWAAGVATGPATEPRAFVLDEVAGQWIALWPLSGGLWHAGAAPHVFPWPGWVGAFLLFRLFDVWKPGPIGWANRRPGPAGVMLDDLIAGLCAAVLVAAAAAVAHGAIR